jgi:hypothetical protein
MMVRSTALLKLVVVATSFLLQEVFVLSVASTTVTRTTQQLRGRPVIHTRIVHKTPGENQREGQQQHIVEDFVDPNHRHGHHILRMRGSARNGKTKDFEIDLTALDERKKSKSKENGSHVRGPAHNHHQGNQVGSSNESRRDRSNPNGHHLIDKHEKVEDNDHQHHPHHLRHESYERSHGGAHADGSNSTHFPQTEPTPQRKTATTTIPVSLPTGFDEHFNQSLYDDLHSAPFEIYESVFGHPLERRDSFPVFIVPEWKNSTGVFSGFSRTATPLVFENMNFLLQWEDISGYSTGVDDDLLHFMKDTNFHSSVIIGKAFGENGKQMAFLGLLVSYVQSTLKNILVPFAKVDNFFHDSAVEPMMSDSTKYLDLESLHEMLDEKRSNDTSLFYHPAMQVTDERKDRVEHLELMHFRRLFQLLIRRSFLFSFGYADCLKNEPRDLRNCLDKTFSIVVRFETSIRGALDEQIEEELSEMNEMSDHGKVREACMSASGAGAIYGMGSCDNNFGGLGAFITSPASVYR